jgi:hypothetical protein
MNNTDRLPAGLEQARAALAVWRGQRRKGDRIPEDVWRNAADAARQYGVNAVSRVLRLDYYHLKRRADRGRSERPASPVFVELSEGCIGEAPGIAEGLSCVVELAKGNGTRMRISVRDVATVDWGKLKEAFLGA